MSTELTPLRALKDIGKLKENGCYVNTTIEYIIIETALKEYEGAKKHIEALNRERIENSIKIKALEIIKKKLPPLMRYALTQYCNKEEFDILSEVL